MKFANGKRYWLEIEVAEVLGINNATLGRRVMRGTFPAPPTTLGNRNYYTDEDLRQIKKDQIAKINEQWLELDKILNFWPNESGRAEMIIPLEYEQVEVNGVMFNRITQESVTRAMQAPFLLDGEQ